MYTIKSKGEFLASLKVLDPVLTSLRLNNIEIDRQEYSIKYNFICDKAVSDELKEKILDEAIKITLPAFKTVTVSVKKIATNDSLVNNVIVNYLRENFPSISIFLKNTDVRSVVLGNVVKYVLRLTEDGVEYVTKNGAMRKLNEYLEKNFCAEFVGSTEVKEPDEVIDITSDEVFEDQLKRIEHRTIKVENVEIIDDAGIGNLALYLEDAISGDVTVCGIITDIKEKETKNGKPFLILHIDDKTSTTSGVYFSKKNTYSRIKTLQIGDCIIARAEIKDYNGKPSLTFNKINRCTFPKDFVKKDKFKNSVPSEYSLIFPQEATTIKVESVFDDKKPLPQELINNTYVVFDLETTGLDVLNNGITEIGAVKIINGKISQHFTTLIKPDYPITEEIVKITGITDELVKTAPKIGAVIPDFIKFIDGAVLVAHNADFDVKFIKRFAGSEEYEINNKVIDTMDYVRRYVPTLKKADLHTMADHFGIVFHHHRALSDAYATAECFIELMKIKGDN